MRGLRQELRVHEYFQLEVLQHFLRIRVATREASQTRLPMHQDERNIQFPFVNIRGREG